MESDSDGEMEEFSGMELPPLINSLKRILSEYPDGGQIIKELIQNAEDAGATEVKLLYDGRNINQDPGKAYRKFFKGPAMCLYNNAIFEDEDWRGIRMIDMSVKESDPLKVGKFGLGFKSVFHLTDYPCVLSGGKLLLIDPQQPNLSKVNAMMDLGKLAGYKKRMDVDAFFKALDGTFGVSRDIISKGLFKGTVFWFPLRQIPSKLSSNLYNEKKVMALFESIESENKSLLIFLKSLTYLSLSKRTMSEGQTDIAVVEVKNASEVSKVREVFRKKIEKLSSNPSLPGVQSIINMTVKCTQPEDQHGQTHVSERTWLVVNYFMGNNASPAFMTLIKDEDLASSPYVSVAAPFSTETGDDPLEGHVFCFLPLPREGTSLTGLPVHVNGFFALNQSRHHVKWLTDEQRQHRITDRDVLWNRHLITEALPVAYAIWIKKAVQIANHHQNDLNYVETVHKSLPVRDSTKGKWQEILNPLFCKIKEGRFLYSHNQQTWVTGKDALFTSPTDHPPFSCNKTVIKSLTQMKKYHVDITDDKVETIQLYMSSDNQQMLTPELFSQFLKANNSYQNMSHNEKIHILQYILKNDDSCRYLNDLQLLPVASGEWKTFRDASAENIYKCTSTQLRLFPGLEDRLLIQESDFPATLFSRFDSMCKQGAFQLTVLADNDQSETAILLKTVIETQMPGTSQEQLKVSGKLNLSWLQGVWQYIISKEMISICQSVPLFPILKGKSWRTADVNIMKLSSNMILAEHGVKKLPDDVCQCLKALDIVIVPSLPKWIPVQTLAYLPDKGSVIQLLTHVQQTASPMQQRTAIQNFNESKASCRREFMLYLHSAKLLQGPCINFLRELKMFPGRDSIASSPEMFSFNDGLKFTTTTNFPIPYPETLLDGFNEAKQFLLKLGAQEISFAELIFLTLQSIQNGRYSKSEERKFMDFFVRHYHEIKPEWETMETIKRMASMVPFIKCNQTFKRPSDLFNPTDKVLQNLFIAEPMFPDPKYDVKILAQLGLKNRDNLTAEDLVTTANILDEWSKSNKKSQDVYKKAKSFMKVLTLQPECLEQYVCGNLLKDVLFNLECVEFKTNRTSNFPKWLPWYSFVHSLCKPSQAKGLSVVNIVGSVMHVVESDSKAVSEAFFWETNIPEDMLIAQFEEYKAGYKVRHEADILVFLRSLYEWLMNYGLTLEKWKNKPIIFVGVGFCCPKDAIIYTDKNDIKLEPHFHYIADTFNDLQDFFLILGCHRNQSIKVLFITLTNIVSQKNVSSSDLNLAVSVIQRLAERKDELTPSQKEQIPLPVHSPDKVCFKPLSKCTFTNNPDDYFLDEDDDDFGVGGDSFANMIFVSKHISEGVAKSLGVKTLQRRTLMDTEELAYEEWGQEEELTTRLKTLIGDGYRDGLSVPKELLQNADDAGAKCIKFLYDERENLDAQESLLDKGMKSCQGPALWVFNDANFTDEDFKNIRKLNGATKANNVRTIGKFGLGFCSVYNVTDVPSFVSGSNIVILDPHRSHLGDALSENSPGLKINLSRKGNRMLCKRNKDQFKPYFEVFGCDLFCKEPFYDGTLFRLPFRTHDEANISKIRSDPYTAKDVLDLLDMFVSNAGNLLLFTQNVQSIEVYHLYPAAKSVSEQKLMFSVKRDCLQWNRDSFSFQSETILSQLASTSMEISEIQKIHIQLDIHKPVKDIHKKNLKHSPMKSSSEWIVSWATGTRESKILASQKKNVLPLAAVAVPCDEVSGLPKKMSELGKGYFENGRLYCFLPIPGPTTVQWHLHGCFDVTSDRRQLRIDTEQDRYSLHSNWNELLMSDAAVNAFVRLLIYFTKISRSGSYLFHTLWPVEPSLPMKPFIHSFFRYIVREDVRIFEGNDGFHSFNEINFLNSNIRSNKDIGSIAYDMLVTFPPRDNSCIVDIPNGVIEGLMIYNDEEIKEKMHRKIVGITELLSVFLKNIDSSYWNSRVQDRNKLSLFALSNDDPDVMEMLQQTKFIPCEHSEILKRPNELIHPSSDVSSMFESSDGVFPINSKLFRSQNVLHKLVRLGMMNTFLPIDLVKERCQTVERLSAVCCPCAISRIQNILRYLSRYSCLREYKNQEMRTLSHISWLPVKSRSSDWPFSWFADSSKELKKFKKTSCKQHTKDKCVLVLGQPQQLHRQHDQYYLACVACLVDENIQKVSSEVWIKLGFSSVEKQQYFKKVVDQLCVISEEYNTNPNKLFPFFTGVYHEIIKHINHGLVLKEFREERFVYLEPLCNKAIVLIRNNRLVTPDVVAIEAEQDCYPYLCRLPESERAAIEFYRAIGVKTHFTVKKVVQALQKNQGGKTKVTDAEVKVVIKLLQNLVEAMQSEGKQYASYGDLHGLIKGPDKSGNLYPTYELVMEDETFKTSVDMRIMHKDFPKSLGEHLGMKSKKRKCVDEISFGISWGQKERLVTRLKGLLKDYPCDSGIMKELLQNSDDAGAKELHFIKDYRTHSTDKVFGSNHLQGPALCVYNDGYFTQADLEGIQNLGIGSKQTDPSKTGQYGLGFNAVYHLTDTPSFLTKGPVHEDSGLLCMLDPLCTNIPVEESDPGKIFLADKVKENFPDVLSGYLENDGFFDSGIGTMFRFPLRCEKSELSSEIITTTKMNAILNGFIAEMVNVLLFVKSVKTIKVSNISSSKLIHEYTLSVSITEEEETKRIRFFDKVKELTKQNTDNLSKNLDGEHFEVTYTIQLQDSREHRQKWLIVQRFGCPHGLYVDKSIVSAFDRHELGLLPLAGIAVHYPDCEHVFQHADSKQVQQHVGNVSNTIGKISNIGWAVVQKAASYFPTSGGSQTSESLEAKQNSGQLFTFLPLPVRTGFPVHINGHFSLDHSRRDLWDEGYRKAWNDMLGRAVIVPSWISAIKYFHRYFTSKTLNDMNVTSWKAIRKMMKWYHNLFPLLNDSNLEFSKGIVGNFYDIIFKEEIELFPVVKQKRKEFLVCWVTLKPSSRMFGAVFNNIESSLRDGKDHTKYKVDLNEQHLFKLEGVLKDVGMCIVESPIYIHETIEELGCPDVHTATPSFVMEFLKTFQSEQHGACFIGEINSAIEMTKFENIERLQCLVSYISRAPEFPSEAEDLPVLLTADDILHQFCSESGIYCSKYSSLLPASQSVFVHEKLLNLFEHEVLSSNGLLRLLDCEEFHVMLQNEDATEFNSGECISWNMEETNKLITPAWIDKFFQFVVDSLVSGQETETFSENLSIFKDWSFLPAVYAAKQHKLLPINLAYCLFLEKSLDQAISRVVQKIGIPSLNFEVFSEPKVKTMVRCILTHTGKPVKLLKCLSHYNHSIVQAALTKGEAETLLTYLESHVPELQSQACIDRLRSLPLYCTRQGYLVHLNAGDVLVLPGQIPIAGLQEWARRSNIVLLKQTERLSNLYNLLGLQCAEVDEFYVQILLPKIDLLPQKYWLEHIKFMKRILNTYNILETQNGQLLLARLRSLPFISVGHKMKRARELYWPDNKVFSSMLSETDFPPYDMRSEYWKELFLLLDMKFEVTDELLLQFATEIAERGRERIRDDTGKKSDLLLSCFLQKVWENTWEIGTYKRIKGIKFICPYTVSEELTDIYQQPDSVSRLICFENSVGAKYANLCWTSLNLLSQIPNHKDKIRLLGICTDPPVDGVVLHFQNVCMAFQEQLQFRTVSTGLVKNIMNEFYVFLQTNIDNNPAIFRRLDQFPVIYLLQHRKLVQAKAVVIELSLEKEIKPYLYRAPVHYGQYFDVFVKIGAKEKLELSHCLFVLQQVQLKVQNQRLLPEELDIAKKTLLNLISVLKENPSVSAGEGLLFLPNRERVLVDSTQLTVSDNSFFEVKLENEVAINYFIGFDMLDIEHADPVVILSKLPQEIQPAILSKCVQSRVKLEEVEEVEDNVRAKRLEEFMHSDEFINGILRLVKYDMLLETKVFDDIHHVSQITNNIKRIKIVCISHLKCVLIYQGHEIPGSEFPEDWHIGKISSADHERLLFYITESICDDNCSDLQWVLSLINGLTELIKECTLHQIRHENHVFSCFSKFEQRSEITYELDKHKIPNLSLPQTFKNSAFPKPGKNVEDHYLPFLVQAIHPFSEEEYAFVAMELEDSSLTNDTEENITAVYIYVRIIRELTDQSIQSDLRRVYLVDTGNFNSTYERIPIYRLYRFVRKREDTGTALVPYGNEPVTDVPFDETCRRIRDDMQVAWGLPERERRRIIARLWMEWHPNRNLHNQEYCTRIFNYTNNVIVLLESGKQVSTIVDERTGRVAPDMSQSGYHTMVMNVDRRASAYTRAYIDNLDDYNRSSNTGRYSHIARHTEARPEITEAKRWMRQAKQDCRLAHIYLAAAQDVDGFNWVCYICHQACEKALRAAHYSKDANKVPARSHALGRISWDLGAEIMQQVQEIELRISDYNRMRYPNAVSRPDIPSDLYSEDDANFALEKARDIIDKVEECFDIG